MAPKNPSDFLKDLVDARNKAEEMRVIAESCHDDTRDIYYRLAQTYDECACVIEKMKKSMAEMRR